MSRCDPRALSSPALVTSCMLVPCPCICAIFPRECLLLGEAGAPCGARLGRYRAVKSFWPSDTTLPGFEQASLVPKPGAQRFYPAQGVPGNVSIPLDDLGRISALCFPITPHRLCLSLFFLFFRRKKGTPRGRRKKAPLFRTRKPPSLPQLRTRRWRCRGRVATRRRWQRRQKVRQVRAVAGNVLSSADFAARSWQRHHTRPLRGCKCQHSQGVCHPKVTPR